MKWVAVGDGLSFFMDGSLPDHRDEDAVIIRIGEGCDTLPTQILPTQGCSVPALRQEKPEDLVSAWVRVWTAGFLAEQSDWDGVVLAHQADLSHWLHVSAGEFVSSMSFLTPRLINILGGAQDADERSISDSMSRPERLAAQLRAAEVSQNPDAVTGHLLGAELAASRAYWLGQNIALIAEGDLANTYASALSQQGCPIEKHSPRDVIPGGLERLGIALGLDGD